MLSLHAEQFLPLATLFLPAEPKRSKGLRPVFFGPCTLGRTWGTRPGKQAWLFGRKLCRLSASNKSRVPHEHSESHSRGFPTISLQHKD